MNNIRKPGHCFLTVDIGGGTTDLSAVQVQDNLQLKEICAERGHCIGGQSVNDAFFQACNDNFKGTEWSKKFMEATPFELMTMEHEFEKGKIAIGTQEMDESIQLQLPRSKRDSIKTGTIKVDKKQATVKITKEENLRFETSFVRDQLFDEACKIINSVIKGVLDKQKEIETVVIVGGFAQSTIVQETIKTFLKKKHPNVTVVVPTSPFRAVLMGAIFYGHDRLIFRSRISRATYGVEIDVRFDGKKHDVRKKWLNGKSGVYYCKHVFDTHVRKGQSVVLGEQTPGKYYMPIYETRSKIRFSLFETTQVPQDGKVMYTTDEGCKKVGEISVDLPDAHESTQKRKVSVQMIYGGTQLSVIATDVTTGKEYDTEINFNV